jgi:23S rRNA pseudouridine1911/1915/1917 synthase
MSAVASAVPAALDGVRVDKAVALLAGLSRSSVDALVERGGVRVDGQRVRNRSTPLRAGQWLEVEDDRPSAPELVGDPTVPFAVVHEDAELIVVDKPAGVVVHPGHGHRTGTLVHGLLARFPELSGVGPDPERPGIVHRLVRGTSGLMVVARTDAAYRALVDQLAERQVTRTYRALVSGSVEGATGVVDAPIGRSASSPVRMAVTRRGKEARTRYQVVDRFTRPVPSTLLTVTLETGRTHQIRVHLAAIGHPVVGDELYRGTRGESGLRERPFLHAERLALSHPGTGSLVEWASDLPDDLRSELAGREA